MLDLLPDMAVIVAGLAISAAGVVVTIAGRKVTSAAKRYHGRWQEAVKLIEVQQLYIDELEISNTESSQRAGLREAYLTEEGKRLASERAALLAKMDIDAQRRAAVQLRKRGRS